MITPSDLVLIPSRIKLSYHRPPHFQVLPDVSRDVEVPEGYIVSTRWVIVCRADVIDAIKGRGGGTVITVGQNYVGPGSRGGHPVNVLLGDIIAERYVNHRDYGRTRYVATLCFLPLVPNRPWRSRDRHRVIHRSHTTH